jgi:hypothetical protein
MLRSKNSTKIFNIILQQAKKNSYNNQAQEWLTHSPQAFFALEAFPKCP